MQRLGNTSQQWNQSTHMQSHPGQWPQTTRRSSRPFSTEDLQLCPSRRCLQETNILATPALVWSQGPAEAKWKNPFQTFLTSTISQGACYLSRQEAQIQAPYMRSDSKLADCQELWLPQRKSNSFVHPTNVYEASTLPRHRYLQVPCWSLWLQLWATCSPWAQGAYNLEGKTDN